MNNKDINEKDWKLFRKKLPIWQERYMSRLVEEYKELLSLDVEASTKFWELDKRIKNNKKDSGVLVSDASRSNMEDILMSLMAEAAITKEDLDGFSEELIKQLYFK